MSKKKEKQSYRLLVVAHPDDETLFFSSVLFQKTDLPWMVICVTNGNADGAGGKRAKQFAMACKKLKVTWSVQWGFPDIYEKRLDIKRLSEHLARLPMPKEVYTHGVVGEYGHPHHQDVSFAVHQFYNKKLKVFSPAYNCLAEQIFKLTPKQYEIKSHIYADIYQSETLRFAQFIPNRNADEFVSLSWAELDEIYKSMIEFRAPNKRKLKKYRWFYDFMAEKNKTKSQRPF